MDPALPTPPIEGTHAPTIEQIVSAMLGLSDDERMEIMGRYNRTHRSGDHLRARTCIPLPMNHLPRLLPYRNPENVDGSKVPKGWRFLYADEPLTPKASVKLWWPETRDAQNGWVEEHPWASLVKIYTYIVPVA